MVALTGGVGLRGLKLCEPGDDDSHITRDHLQGP